MVNKDIYPKILFNYLLKIFLKNLFIVLLVLISLILLVDFIELYRRASIKIDLIDTEKNILLKLSFMSVLKLPNAFQNILPITVLISSIITFTNWRQNNYFVIVRTIGISLWKSIMPICVGVIIVGIISMIFINPLSSICNLKYKILEETYFGHNIIKGYSLNEKGIWIYKNAADGKLILNAKTVKDSGNILNDIEIFILDKKDVFKKKIVAKKGEVKNESLKLKNVLIFSKNNNIQKYIEYLIPINESFQNFDIMTEKPENLDILDLYSYIKLMRQTGLSYSSHLIYFLKVITQPFLMTSMILICAPLILKNNERKFPLTIICLSLLVGFIVYFTVDFMFAFGTMNVLNPYLAGIGPVALGLFFGCFLVSSFDEIK